MTPLFVFLFFQCTTMEQFVLLRFSFNRLMKGEERRVACEQLIYLSVIRLHLIRVFYDDESSDSIRDSCQMTIQLNSLWTSVQWIDLCFLSLFPCLFGDRWRFCWLSVDLWNICRSRWRRVSRWKGRRKRMFIHPKCVYMNIFSVDQWWWWWWWS